MSAKKPPKPVEPGQVVRMRTPNNVRQYGPESQNVTVERVWWDTGINEYRVAGIDESGRHQTFWYGSHIIGTEEAPNNPPAPAPAKIKDASSPVDYVDQTAEMLPREVLAEHAAASLWAKLAAEITTAAEQTAPHQRPSRSATLSRVQILRIISEQAHQLAVSQAIKAVSDGATLSTTAAALGVSRQRVHQLIRERRSRPVQRCSESTPGNRSSAGRHRAGSTLPGRIVPENRKT